MSDVINTSSPAVRSWIKSVWNLGYSTTLGTFRQTSGSTLDVPDGVPVKLSGGKYAIADGSTAVGILAEPLFNVATSTDVDCVVLVRGPAEVYRDIIDWQSGSTDPDADGWEDSMIASLAALNPPIMSVDSASPSITL